MRFLSVEEVISMHDELVLKFGGLHGVRDMGLLISAIEMPKATMFGEFLHESIYDKAAAYLYHVICNHAFIDGNKRTGIACALVFLKENGVTLNRSISEIEELTVQVAEGKTEKQEISKFFRNNS